MRRMLGAVGVGIGIGMLVSLVAFGVNVEDNMWALLVSLPLVVFGSSAMVG